MSAPTIRWSITRTNGSACRAPTAPISERLLVELDPRLAEEDRVQRCQTDGPVDAEDRDLEFVARFHLLGEHNAIGHVEALDRRRARAPAAPRHRAVDEGFGVVVDGEGEHRDGAARIEIADLRWDGQ